MSETIRPGGVTALSIINFIFGGIQAFGVLFALMALGCAAVFQGGLSAQPLGVRLFSIGMDGLICIALIISGVGLLKVNRITGRWFGTLYAVCAIVKTVALAFSGEAFFASFTIFTIISLVYPVLVLIFIHVVFRDLWARTHSVFMPKKRDGRENKPVKPVLLVSIHSFRQTVRSFIGVLLCMAIMIVGLFTAQLVLLPVEMFINQAESSGMEISEQEIVEEMERVILPILSRILGTVGDEELPDTPEFLDLRALNIGYVNDSFKELENPKAEQWAYFLLREQPGFLSLLFLLFFLIIPPVIVFSGFNQIAGDARNKGLRYLLMRTKRSTLFLGKYLGSIMITAVLLLILVASVVLYMHFKLSIYDPGRLLNWGLWGLGAFIIFSLPFISLSVTFSALVDSPIGALGSSLGVMALFPIFAFFLKDAWEPLGVIQYVLPFKLGFSLVHYQWWMVCTAVAGMIGYSAVYLFLGYLYFKKRDL